MPPRWAAWTRWCSLAGTGENATLIRERICDGLGCLGLAVHRERNAMNAPLISSDAGCVKVRVIRTDEELMIARSVTRVLNLGSIRET
jgi:propionate kinase